MWTAVKLALVSTALLQTALAADVLTTDGFTNCGNGTSTINVQKIDISFDKSTSQVTFDVAGSSSQQQEVTASLVVLAYGIQVYANSFDPCDDSTKVDQLCPGMRSPHSWSMKANRICSTTRRFCS